jgi:ABC-type Mn2+/Zn2+ transport system ATPase subunit
MEDAMRKKTQKQQLSTDDLLKTKTMHIELAEKELGQVSGGNKKKATIMEVCAGGVHLKEATIT